jgi:septal ring factor EnvC (AmiA/AmiB activator)
VGFGTLVIVDHGANAFTLYGHLQQAAVAPGGSVDRGSVVGRAGRNPDGTDAVYFELRIDGRPVDPVQWLKARS